MFVKNRLFHMLFCYILPIFSLQRKRSSIFFKDWILFIDFMPNYVIAPIEMQFRNDDYEFTDFTAPVLYVSTY